MSFSIPIRHSAALLLHKPAMTMHGYLVERLFQCAKFVIGKRYVPRAQIFYDAFLIFRAGYGHYVGIFVQHPAKRYLRLCRVFALCIFFQKVEYGLICRIIFLTELGDELSHVVAVRKIRVLCHPAGQKSAGDGRKWHDAYIVHKAVRYDPLLHAALHQVLGPTALQKGSNITAERLRFDFTWPEPMTAEQKAAVEKLVNEWIAAGIPVTKKMTTVEEAKAEGAMALFGAKYGDQVSLYSIGDISKEICCGPHVENTKELGSFKIQKEQSSSAGVRRIKAVVGNLS